MASYVMVVKSHELHATAQAPVPEWRKIDQFMKNIKCSNLQNDYRNLKDSSLYQSFTAMYNKLNENYRTMIQQGILKPVSVFKREIKAVDSNGGNEPHQGGSGRGYGRGRGRGGRESYNPQIDLTCLPSGIDLQNLTFSDEKWHGFSQEQKNAILALRNLNNNRGNQKEKGG